MVGPDAADGNIYCFETESVVEFTITQKQNTGNKPPRDVTSKLSVGSPCLILVYLGPRTVFFFGVETNEGRNCST